jgi:hypothetical protein
MPSVKNRRIKGRCADCRKRKALVSLNGDMLCEICFRDRLLLIRAQVDFYLELVGAAKPKL